ncbi:hypothetical protein ABMA70_05065 [Halobacteriovorax sp. XZX-3]|uniref:hypothetical protein n=1 Tax=unclassified Halobacteriovorax TaxID=2639665 RepID=UPI003719A81D
MDYISIFKTYNIVLEEDLVVNNNLSIHRDTSYVHTYNVSNIGADHYMLHDHFFNKFPRLSSLPEKLANSEVILKSKSSSFDHNSNPFDLDTCSLLSIALAILFDNYFVVGGELFYNTRDGNKSNHLAPWTGVFKGEKNQNILDSTMLDDLKTNYELVEKAFKVSLADDLITKLFFYFLRVITEAPSYQFTVVKMGIPNIINPEESPIVNAAMMFEYVFTKEGYKLEDGVKLWNTSFSSYNVNFDEIRLIHKYRSIKVHSNATGAKKIIDVWKRQNTITNDKLIPKLVEMSIRNSRVIVRGVASDLHGFKAFIQSLP